MKKYWLISLFACLVSANAALGQEKLECSLLLKQLDKGSVSLTQQKETIDLSQIVNEALKPGGASQNMSPVSRIISVPLVGNKEVFEISYHFKNLSGSSTIVYQGESKIVDAKTGAVLEKYGMPSGSINYYLAKAKQNAKGTLLDLNMSNAKLDQNGKTSDPRLIVNFSCQLSGFDKAL